MIAYSANRKTIGLEVQYFVQYNTHLIPDLGIQVSNMAFEVCTSYWGVVGIPVNFWSKTIIHLEDLSRAQINM